MPFGFTAETGLQLLIDREVDLQTSLYAVPSAQTLQLINPCWALHTRTTARFSLGVLTHRSGQAMMHMKRWEMLNTTDACLMHEVLGDAKHH